MKRSKEKNFYEFLGVDFRASPFEISHAYKQLSQLYHEDSLASYSFFSRREREEIQRTLDEAYSTLIHEERRSQYDRSLIDKGILPEGEACSGDRKLFRCLSASNNFEPPRLLALRGELRDRVSSNPLIQEILSRDALTGKDLRRIRDELGISLEVVGEVTKVGLRYLRAIEEDQPFEMTSKVFLKSFVKAYAECLGLDPDIVARRYLKSLEG